MLDEKKSPEKNIEKIDLSKQDQEVLEIGGKKKGKTSASVGLKKSLDKNHLKH